jgi:hypothetical protein
VYGPGSSADFLTEFKSNFRVNIVSDTDEEVVFDLVGVEAPVANTLRRILLAEVSCGTNGFVTTRHSRSVVLV